MSSELSIDLAQLQELAAEVRKTRRPATVDITADVVAVLKPAARRRVTRTSQTPTQADIDAAWSAFGSWKDD